jgi:hypothetical protein
LALDTDGGHRGFFDAKSSHFDPSRVLPERHLPADWSLPGHWPGPGRQVTRRRKARHVGADLGQDALRASTLDTDHGAQQLNGRRKRAQLLLDRVREPVDLLIEEVDVREDRPDP